MKENGNKIIVRKRDITTYVILRILVILVMIIHILRGNFENVFMCILTLILFRSKEFFK